MSQSSLTCCKSVFCKYAQIWSYVNFKVHTGVLQRIYTYSNEKMAKNVFALEVVLALLILNSKNRTPRKFDVRKINQENLRLEWDGTGTEKIDFPWMGLGHKF